MMQELSLNILDITQNSISAGATVITIDIAVSANGNKRVMTVSIEDNGCGMSEEMAASVTDPFVTTRTTRKVGMGISLFKMAAELTGGSLDIQSAKGNGTVISASFYIDHIDCVPLGDMATTVSLLVSMKPDIDFIYRYSVNGHCFELSTADMREQLGEIPLSEPSVLAWIREAIVEETAALDN